MGVVAGPFVFFEDYMSFIRGHNFSTKEVKYVKCFLSFSIIHVNRFQDDKSRHVDPPYLVSSPLFFLYRQSVSICVTLCINYSFVCHVPFTVLCFVSFAVETQYQLEE